jgi:flagellar basal-body rod modification protein FlgD
MTDAIDATKGSGVNQTDYLKLFMQELTYQDPLKPIDNREFMAQMAQFSALQEAQASSKSLDMLVSMTNSNQSLMLLGKNVKVAGSDESIKIEGVQFLDQQPPKLMVTMNGGQVLKELKEITQVN